MTNPPVLFVSEDVDVIATFKVLFQEAPLPYHICRTVEEFLINFMRQRPKLAVFDLSLFKRHELQLSKFLSRGLNDLVIIVITTEEDEDEREIIQTIMTGKVLYRLIKPFTRDEAQSVVAVLARFWSQA